MTHDIHPQNQTKDTLPAPAEAGLPSLHAAQSMQATGQAFAEQLTARDMLDMLRVAMGQDSEGAGTMYAQTQVLDCLFHRLTIKAMSKADENGAPVHDYVDKNMVDLALRTQKLCRTTFQALHALKSFESVEKKEKNYKRTERW